MAHGRGSVQGSLSTSAGRRPRSKALRLTLTAGLTTLVGVTVIFVLAMLVTPVAKLVVDGEVAIVKGRLVVAPSGKRLRAKERERIDNLIKAPAARDLFERGEEARKVMRPVADASEPATARLRVKGCNGKGGSGTAFFVDEHNLVTAFHVVEGAIEMTVEISGESFRANTVAISPADDVAVVSIVGAPNHGTLVLSERPPGFGEPLVTIGKVRGITWYEYGHVIAVDPTWIFFTNRRAHREVVWSTADSRPGDSGGPVIGSDGTVAAVVTHGGIVSRETAGTASSAALRLLDKARRGPNTTIGTSCADRVA